MRKRDEVNPSENSTMAYARFASCYVAQNWPLNRFEQLVYRKKTFYTIMNQFYIFDHPYVSSIHFNSKLVVCIRDVGR